MDKLTDKEIRFIDSGYRELFKIPDGGKIAITRTNGEELVRVCRYHDDYHFELLRPDKDYGDVYHICQFAEIMERNGNLYEPITEHEYKLEAASPEEAGLAFADRDKAERGCIGRLRGDFDRDGNSFWTSWENENAELKTDLFRTEFNEVVNHFRRSEQMPLLKNRSSMKRVCREHKGQQLDSAYANAYLYKVKTDAHTYFIRCNPTEGNYNFYIYAYDNKRLNRYMDIRFAEQNIPDMNADKFFKNETGFTEVYYNPDAVAGGQIVYVEISNDDIKDAAKHCKKPAEFFSELEGIGREYLIDAGTPGFRENLKSFVNRKADFEGTSKRTMQGMMKSVGIKTRENEPER